MEGKYKYVKMTYVEDGCKVVSYGAVDEKGCLTIGHRYYFFDKYLKEYQATYKFVPKSEVMQYKLDQIEQQIAVLKRRKCELFLKEYPEDLTYFEPLVPTK